MVATSRLNRVLTSSFRFFGYSYYLNEAYLNTDSINGSNGLFSKFVKVNVRNADGTFEFPMCAVRTFLEGVEKLITEGVDLVTSDRVYETFSPIHCINSNVPYWASTVESSFMDSFFAYLPYGAVRVNIGSRASGESAIKSFHYQAPGIVINSGFNPLLYLTIKGKYEYHNGSRNTFAIKPSEYKVHVAHRVFNQEDSISKFILKKVVPFYFNNPVGETIIFPKTDIKITSWSVLQHETSAAPVKIELEPLNKIIYKVAVPSNYETMENDVSALLTSEEAIKVLSNPKLLSVPNLR